MNSVFEFKKAVTSKYVGHSSFDVLARDLLN